MKSARAYIPVPKFDLPAINIGAGFDLRNGEIRMGMRGETIIAGGLTFSTSICGKENSFKSTLAGYMALVPFGQFRGHSRYTKYDTEGHGRIARDEMLAKRIPGLEGFDFYDEDGLYLFTRQDAVPGEKFYANFIELTKDKLSKENIKSAMLTTPFIKPGKEGAKPEPELMIEPDILTMDTATRFQTTAGLSIVEENEIGGNATTAGNLKGSADRNWLFSSINYYLLGNGGYFISTAHVGKEFKMDRHERSKKQLLDLTTGYQIKGAPQSYTSLTTDMWFVFESARFINKTTKAPQFPRSPEENKLVNGPDLNIIGVRNLRCKTNESGYPFKVIISQEEGVKPELTNYFYLYENEYGFNGPVLGKHALTLYPDTNIGRTTIRTVSENDYAMGRALHITAELCQLDKEWVGWEDRHLLCSPTELYEDIKKLGYDWNELLSTTRFYWLPVELEKDNKYHFLSTIDLLKMRAGLYTPYWMKKKK